MMKGSPNMQFNTLHRLSAGVLVFHWVGRFDDTTPHTAVHSLCVFNDVDQNPF